MAPDAPGDAQRRPRFVILSDTHGRHRSVRVPAGDVLVHCGDFTNRGEPDTVADFNDWLGALPHPHKIVIAGNHDLSFEERPHVVRPLLTNATYLQDEGVEVLGVKIWGSPWTPRFFDWAFNADRCAIAQRWHLIPADTDLLVTHGPPRGVMDWTARGEAAGCLDLLCALGRVRPKAHCFGHIHEGFGVAGGHPEPLFVNAALLSPGGWLRQPPVLEWWGDRFTVAPGEDDA